MFGNDLKEPLWKRSIRGIGIMKKLLYLALSAFLASLFSPFAGPRSGHDGDTGGDRRHGEKT